MAQEVGSFSRVLGGGGFSRDATAAVKLRPRALFRRSTRLDIDDLRGAVGNSRDPPTLAQRTSQGLDQRLASSRRFGFKEPHASGPWRHDPRQRAVVKIHFFGHGGGGDAALKAHGRYLQRDNDTQALATETPTRGSAAPLKDHADYLSRERGSPFYDQFDSNVDGPARLAVWAREDKRHFRIILAAENGAELGDLKAYVREVMERAEAALGAPFEWVAVDHWDTDNPHTHIVLRGRRAGERALILPRDFVKHGLRNLAREAATERLGVRTPEDERLALTREARAHRPTRLDALLEQQMSPEKRIRLSAIRAAGGEHSVQTALKQRLQELERLGLAVRDRRDVFQLADDWREVLKRLELHLDVRKRMTRQRSQARGVTGRIVTPRDR